SRLDLVSVSSYRLFVDYTHSQDDELHQQYLQNRGKAGFSVAEWNPFEDTAAVCPRTGAFVYSSTLPRL
ncbi:unnamed protein product, partial [Amoebophrya sp. A25]